MRLPLGHHPDVRCSGGSSSRITVEQETTNTPVARVEGAGGLAVFSERFAPGWRATIDGQDAPILRVDGLLRGICVPEGEHTVALLPFRPFTLYLGACVSGLALIVATFPQFAAYHRSSSVPRFG